MCERVYEFRYEGSHVSPASVCGAMKPEHWNIARLLPRAVFPVISKCMRIEHVSCPNFIALPLVLSNNPAKCDVDLIEWFLKQMNNRQREVICFIVINKWIMLTIGAALKLCWKNSHNTISDHSVHSRDNLSLYNNNEMHWWYNLCDVKESHSGTRVRRKISKEAGSAQIHYLRTYFLSQQLILWAARWLKSNLPMTQSLVASGTQHW